MKPTSIEKLKNHFNQEKIDQYGNGYSLIRLTDEAELRELNNKLYIVDTNALIFELSSKREQLNVKSNIDAENLKRLDIILSEVVNHNAKCPWALLWNRRQLENFDTNIKPLENQEIYQYLMDNQEKLSK